MVFCCTCCCCYLLLLLLLERSSSSVVVVGALFAQLSCFGPLPWLLGSRHFTRHTERIEQQQQQEEEEGRLEAEAFFFGSLSFLVPSPLICVQKISILRGEGAFVILRYSIGWYGMIIFGVSFHGNWCFVILPGGGALCLVTDEQEGSIKLNRLVFLRLDVSPTVLVHREWC